MSSSSSDDEYLMKFATDLDRFISLKRSRSSYSDVSLSSVAKSIRAEETSERQLIPAIGNAVEQLPPNTNENDILAANIDMGGDSQESVSTATTAISETSGRMNANLARVRGQMQTVLDSIEDALNVKGNERMPQEILDQVMGLLDPSVSDIQSILFNLSALEQTRENFKRENPGGIFTQLPDAIAQWGFDTTLEISQNIFELYIKLLEKTIKYTPPAAAAGFSSILLMSLFSESTIGGLPVSQNIKNMIMGTKYVIDSSSKTALVAGAIAGVFKSLSPDTELPRPRVPTPEEMAAATELARNAYGNASDIGCKLSSGAIACERVAKSATKMLRDAIVSTTNVLGAYAAIPFRGLVEPAEARAFASQSSASQSSVSSMTDNGSYRSPPGSPIAEEVIVGKAMPIMEPAGTWTDRLLGSPTLDEIQPGSPIAAAYAYNEDDESSTNSNPRKRRRTTQGEAVDNFGGKSRRKVKSKATKKRRYKMAKKGGRKTKRRIHKRTMKRYRNKKRR